MDILLEDDSLLVINKPAGITVNRSETTKEGETVQDWIEKYLHKTALPLPSSSSDEDDSTDTANGYDIHSAFVMRSGLAHRIDKETSGILVIAKTESAFANLLDQFKERRVKKTYLALSHGRITPQTGEINVPVGRLPWNRRQFGVVPGGRESKTTYEVIGYFRTDDKRREVVTLVKAFPLTGRTHQIRVHLQYLGFPIFSDFLYAGRKTQRDDRKLLERVFLHASSIRFTHPVKETEVTIEAPLPQELAKVMDHLVPIV